MPYIDKIHKLCCIFVNFQLHIAFIFRNPNLSLQLIDYLYIGETMRHKYTFLNLSLIPYMCNNTNKSEKKMRHH